MNRTPEEVIQATLLANPPINSTASRGVWATMSNDTRSAWLTDKIMRDLTGAGFTVVDELFDAAAVNANLDEVAEEIKAMKRPRVTRQNRRNPEDYPEDIPRDQLDYPWNQAPEC